MRIKLKRTMFAPDISGNDAKTYVGRNGRPIARGHRLRKGEHTVPDEWRDKLPRDARILDDDEEVFEEEEETPEKTLHEAANETSVANAAAEQERQINEAAEAQRQANIAKNRLASLEKARAKRRANKEAAEKLIEENKTND